MTEDSKNIFWGRSTDTPLGRVWIAAGDLGLVAVQIGGQENYFTQRLAARHKVALIFSNDRAESLILQIDAYLQGKQKYFDTAIHWAVMSPFQQAVLRVVHGIPYGETRSYGQIAKQIGMPGAARAVGRANATNPMPLVIPCHRVIGSDGNLRGYGSGEGVKTKAWLLDLEQSEH